MRRAIILLMVILSGACWALEVPYRSRPAESGIPGEWLSSLSASARDAGLGNASVALTGAASPYANPAGMVGDRMGEATLLVSPLLFAGQFQSLAVSHPLSPAQSVGLTFLHMASGEAERTNVFGESQGSFDEQDLAFLMSYGLQMSSIMRLGATVKVLNQSLGEYGATGFGLDAGIQEKIGSSLTVGFAAQNIISPSMRLKDETDTVPLALRAGAAYSFRLYGTPSLLVVESSRLGVGEKDRVARWGLGLETRVLDDSTFPLCLRIGANHREYTMGFGLSKGAMRFDYAAVFHELGLLHRFGFTVHYGVLNPFAEERLKTAMNKVRDREMELKQLNEELRKEKERLLLEAEIKTAIREAQILFENERYKESEVIIDRVLKKVPEDPMALGIKANIRQHENQLLARNYLIQGKALYEKSAYREAVQLLIKSLVYDKGLEEAEIFLSMAQVHIYLDEKNYEGAEKNLQKVVKMDPDNKEAMALYERLRDVVDAYGKDK